MPFRHQETMQKSKIVNKSVGELVHKIREEQGMSQLEMSKELGIDQTQLSRIEKGKREMGVRPWLVMMYAYEPNCPYHRDLEQGKCCKTHKQFFEAIKVAVETTKGKEAKKPRKKKMV